MSILFKEMDKRYVKPGTPGAKRGKRGGWYVEEPSGKKQQPSKEPKKPSKDMKIGDKISFSVDLSSGKKDGKLVDPIFKGTTGEIIEVNSSWVKVKTPDGKIHSNILKDYIEGEPKPSGKPSDYTNEEPGKQKKNEISSFVYNLRDIGDTRRWAYGTKDNKWHLIDKDDRDYKDAITHEDVINLGSEEEEVRKKYLGNKILEDGKRGEEPAGKQPAGKKPKKQSQTVEQRIDALFEELEIAQKAGDKIQAKKIQDKLDTFKIPI